MTAPRGTLPPCADMRAGPSWRTLPPRAGEPVERRLEGLGA